MIDPFPLFNTPSRTGITYEFIDQQSASLSANIDFSWSKPYDYIMFITQEMRTSTVSQALTIRTSSDGGSTYDSGASDYDYTAIEKAASINHNSSDATDEIHLTHTGFGSGLFDVADAGLSCVGWIFHPTDTNNYTTIYGLGALYDASFINAEFNGRRLSDGLVDGIRFRLSGGANIRSGMITLYGVFK